MEERRRTWFDAGGLILTGRDDAGPRSVAWHGAAMHYWRTPRADWRRCLDQLAGLGVTVVESYVPWGVHERAAGGHDWSGDRDLGGWLDQVAAAGLVAALRPGPHINAELTWFGFPERVVRDPELGARGAHGGPVWLPAPPRAFPVPSYASRRFHDEVAAWYRAVAEAVGERLWPDGPVVAIQVDNEPHMFFRAGAFDHDYHPDALAWWHEEHDQEPPRSWSAENAGLAAAWVRFKDQYLARALAGFTRALDDAGFAGVARFGNLPPGEPFFSDLPRLEEAIGGPVGLDVYASAAGLASVRRRALHVVGSTDHVPVVPELGCGFGYYLPPFDDADQRTATLAALAAGVRGLSFYMGVGRDRWIGGAVDGHGRRRPAAAWLAAIFEALREVEWTGLRRRAPVALVCSRADVRHGLASSLLDPLPPAVSELLDLGPGHGAELGRDRAAIAHRRWFDAVAAALDLARVGYTIVDEGATPARWAAARAIVCPTFDRVDRQLWRALKQAAADQRVVVIGPDTPTRDELDRPLGDDAAPPRRAGRMRAGSLDDVAGLADDLAALAPPDDWIVERPAGVLADVFEDGAGRVRVLLVLNPGPRRVGARVLVPVATSVRDPLSGDRFEEVDGRLAVPLGGHDARMLIVDSP